MRPAIPVALAALLALGGRAGSPSHAQSAGRAEDTPARIVIRTPVLLDGKGGMLEDQQVVIEGSKILSVGPGIGPVTHDLAGLTLMPGWIDTHVHMGWY